MIPLPSDYSAASNPKAAAGEAVPRTAVKAKSRCTLSSIAAGLAGAPGLDARRRAAPRVRSADPVSLSQLRAVRSNQPGSSSDSGQGRCSADLQRPSLFCLSHLVSAPTDVAEDPFLADVACLCNLIVLPGVTCLCNLIVFAGVVQL